MPSRCWTITIARSISMNWRQLSMARERSRRSNGSSLSPALVSQAKEPCDCGNQENEAHIAGGRQADKPNGRLPKEAFEPHRLRHAQEGRLSHRKRRHRECQQAHFPRSTQTTRCLVVPQQRQQCTETPLCKYNGTFDRVIKKHREDDIRLRQAQCINDGNDPSEGPA